MSVDNRNDTDLRRTILNRENESWPSNLYGRIDSFPRELAENLRNEKSFKFSTSNVLSVSNDGLTGGKITRSAIGSLRLSMTR